MNCRDARQEVIGAADPTAAARRHLDQCDECRLFCADLVLIQQALDTPVSTPSSLRVQTLARSQEMLREKLTAVETSPWHSLRHTLSRPGFVAAAAALGVAIFVTWISLQIDGAQDDATDSTLKLAIFQMVAQNVFTALFLPAFLLFKGGLVRSPFRALKSGV
jgi:hypothetical protein